MDDAFARITTTPPLPVISTGSGHDMVLYQPKFVADNIIDVVDRVRRDG